MKRMCFFNILILFFSVIIYADENISFTGQQYIFAQRRINEYDKEQLDSNQPFVEIIGWSKTGLVAYRYITSGSESGFTHYHFEILNTIDDSIIIHDSMIYVAEEYFGLGANREDGSATVTMREYWDGGRRTEDRSAADKWNELLERHQINGRIINAHGEIRENNAIEFPMNNLECWFDYTLHSRGENRNGLIEWKLIIGNSRIQKTITHVTEKVQLDTEARKIIGYYKSPYENRIVVVVNDYGTYYRETFHVDLYGCNMDIGLD